MSAYTCLEIFFGDLYVLVRKLASLFGHSMQVSMQVKLAAFCGYLHCETILFRTYYKCHYDQIFTS